MTGGGGSVNAISLITVGLYIAYIVDIVLLRMHKP